MMLTPTEQERLTIFTAAELARKHRSLGIRLSHPEAVAYICDELLYGARLGRSLAALRAGDHAADHRRRHGRRRRDAGGAERRSHVPRWRQDDHRASADPAGHAGVDAGAPRTGEIIAADGTLETQHAGRRRVTLRVNTGDRPVQVGSHYHFFEANAALEFDRAAAFGMRLDVPAGASARFEPGRRQEGDAGRARRRRRGHAASTTSPTGS